MEWSREEVEAIVADYLKMLTFELAGQSYSKTEHRRKLQERLQDRSDASIEFKHGNISAAMIDLGFPYIRGYKPRSNYQALLAIVAAEQVRGTTTLDKVALAAVEQPALMPSLTDFTKVRSEAPQKQNRATESINPPSFQGRKTRLS